MKTTLAQSFLILAFLVLGACDSAQNQAPNSVNAGAHASELAQLVKKAETGDAKSQLALGLRYSNGEAVVKDDVKAVAWFRRSAMQGNAEAQKLLGHAYETGKGVDQNSEAAFTWWLKAAMQGDSQGEADVGAAYFSGHGVAADRTKAIFFLKKSMANGYISAKARLGLIYAVSDGNPAEKAQGVEYVLSAAGKGNVDGQRIAGFLFKDGLGVKKDAAKSFGWFEGAANQGDSISQRELGHAYENGAGVAMDKQSALKWLTKAAGQDDEEALVRLIEAYDIGEIFYTTDYGLGVPKNYKKAHGYALRAAALGSVYGQAILAHDFAFGRGVDYQDCVLAYAWANLVLASNVEDQKADAPYVTKYCEKLMSSAEIAEAQELSSGWKKGRLLVRGNGKSGGNITTPTGPSQLSKFSSGTVFVVNKGGDAITNFHVVESCSELRLEGVPGTATLITSDRINDLALVRLPAKAESFATISSSSNDVRQGQAVVVFGYPLNSVLSSGGNLTSGMVSALTGLGNNTNQLQITAPIQPGSSGSPVFNMRAEVVGVVSMKLSDSAMVKATGGIGQNVNFAINGQTLRSFLDAHQITYANGKGWFVFEKDAADIADEARRSTFILECWK
jgi:hypothetical protein